MPKQQRNKSKENRTKDPSKEQGPESDRGTLARAGRGGAPPDGTGGHGLSQSQCSQRNQRNKGECGAEPVRPTHGEKKRRCCNRHRCLTPGRHAGSIGRLPRAAAQILEIRGTNETCGPLAIKPSCRSRPTQRRTLARGTATTRKPTGGRAGST